MSNTRLGRTWCENEELGVGLYAFDECGNRDHYEYNIRFRGKQVKHLGKVDLFTALAEWKKYLWEVCSDQGKGNRRSAG